MSLNDVVFTFSVEMLEDAGRREFCRPPDQTLLALAGDHRVGRLLIADSLRSLPVSLVRRRPVKLCEQITLADRPATRVRLHRLRITDSTRLSSVERAYRRYGQLLGRALAREQDDRGPRPASTALVTYHPFVAAFADAPWIRKVIFVAQDDWATGEGVDQWWPIYRESYRRIEERNANIFAVSEELASRISPRVTVVPNGVSPAVWRPRHPAPARIAALPRPRAIYTGTLDDRLERRLVERTVEAVGTLIMMGHVGHPPTVNWLRSLDGVHVFDTVGQTELAATVQACDIAPPHSGGKALARLGTVGTRRSAVYAWRDYSPGRFRRSTRHGLVADCRVNYWAHPAIQDAPATNCSRCSSAAWPMLVARASADCQSSGRTMSTRSSSTPWIGGRSTDTTGRPAARYS